MSYEQRRGGRVAEGAPLLREYTLIAYRGFESLSLRHFKASKSPKPLAAIDILPAVSGAVDKTVDILNVFQY